MKLTAKANIKNRFDIKIEHTDTGKVEWLKAENIVLDACFTRLVNFNTYFSHIHFGTGTGTLSAARTSLFTFLSQKAANTVQTVRAHPTSRWVRSIVINPEEHVGVVLTEVGIAYGTASSNLCTHAFIEDSEGNPISLTKTSTMVVTIYATVYFQLGAIDSMYGGKWRFVQPLANNELLSYLMGASYPTQQFRVTRAPEFSNGTAPASHGQSANIAPADWIKDAANKKVTTPVPSTRRLGISTGNGEVRGFGLGSSDTLGTFRGQFPITGVHTSKAITETIGAGDGVKTGFNPTWGMLVSSPAAKLFVDSVEVDVIDYDVKYGYPHNRNIAPFLLGAEATAGGIDPLGLLLSGTVSTAGNAIEVIAEIPNEFLAEGIAAIGGRATQSDTSVLMSSKESLSDPSWTNLLSVSPYPTSYTEYNLTTSLPAGHKFIRFRSTRSSFANFAQFVLLLPVGYIFTFHTPPASGTITADYTVDYVPKDSNHVLDLQCTIQYGEIV